MLLWTHEFFCEVFIVCISQLSNISWQTSLQAWSTLFELQPFWIASKPIFLWGRNNFCYKPMPNNPGFTLMEKFFKKIILLFSKKFPLFIEWSMFNLIRFVSFKKTLLLVDKSFATFFSVLVCLLRDSVQVS